MKQKTLKQILNLIVEEFGYELLIDEIKVKQLVNEFYLLDDEQCFKKLLFTCYNFDMPKLLIDSITKNYDFKKNLLISLKNKLIKNTSIDKFIIVEFIQIFIDILNLSEESHLDFLYIENISKLYDNSNNIAFGKDYFFINMDWAWQKDLYKISYNGNEKILLKEGFIYDIFLYDEWLYYTDEKFLYRLNINKSTKELVNKLNGQIINIYDDNIYYYSRSIYKINLDGSNKIDLKINDISINNRASIKIYRGWIYWSDFEEKKLYRCRVNGKNKNVFENIQTSFFVVHDNWIYYSDLSGKNNKEGGALKKININNREIFFLGANKVTEVKVYDKWVFYKNINGYDTRCLLDGTYHVNLDEYIDYRYISFYDNFIYYLTDVYDWGLKALARIDVNLKSQYCFKATELHHKKCYLYDTKKEDYDYDYDFMFTHIEDKQEEHEWCAIYTPLT